MSDNVDAWLNLARNRLRDLLALAHALFTRGFAPFVLTGFLCSATAVSWHAWSDADAKQERAFRNEVERLLATRSEPLRPDSRPVLTAVARAHGNVETKLKCFGEASPNAGHHEELCNEVRRVLAISRDLGARLLSENADERTCAVPPKGVHPTSDFECACNGYFSDTKTEWSNPGIVTCAQRSKLPPLHRLDRAGCDDPTVCDASQGSAGKSRRPHGSLLVPSRLGRLDAARGAKQVPEATTSNVHRRANGVNEPPEPGAASGDVLQAAQAELVYPRRVRRAVMLSRVFEPVYATMAPLLERVSLVYFVSVDGVVRFWGQDGRGTYEMHGDALQMAGRSYVLAFEANPLLRHYATEPYLDNSGAGLISTECVPLREPDSALLGAVCVDYPVPPKSAKHEPPASEYLHIAVVSAKVGEKVEVAFDEIGSGDVSDKHRKLVHAHLVGEFAQGRAMTDDRAGELVAEVRALRRELVRPATPASPAVASVPAASGSSPQRASELLALQTVEDQVQLGRRQAARRLSEQLQNRVTVVDKGGDPEAFLVPLKREGDVFRYLMMVPERKENVTAALWLWLFATATGVGISFSIWDRLRYERAILRDAILRNLQVGVLRVEDKSVVEANDRAEEILGRVLPSFGGAGRPIEMQALFDWREVWYPHEANGKRWGQWFTSRPDEAVSPTGPLGKIAKLREVQRMATRYMVRTSSLKQDNRETGWFEMFGSPFLEVDRRRGTMPRLTARLRPGEHSTFAIIEAVSAETFRSRTGKEPGDEIGEREA